MTLVVSGFASLRDLRLLLLCDAPLLTFLLHLKIRNTLSCFSVIMSISWNTNKVLEGAAVFSIGIITGANIYISGFEVTARNSAESKSYQLDNWQRMVPVFRDIVKPFGVAVNALMGAILYRSPNPKTSSWWIPFTLLGLLGPWTVFMIVPTNEKLAALKVGDAKDEAQATELVEKWGRVHMMRTVLSIFAFAGGIASSMES